MKKIYVAGPYSATDVLSVLKNIGRGEYWSSQLFMRGFAPFTPWHDKTFVIQNWKEDFNVEDFYNYSLEWLRVSDAVFVVPNQVGLKDWGDSKGTLYEIGEASKLGIPVFHSIKELEAWKKQ
jgi:nucleoside 2-deoxyribosyltransferase